MDMTTVYLAAEDRVRGMQPGPQHHDGDVADLVGSNRAGVSSPLPRRGVPAGGQSIGVAPKREVNLTVAGAVDGKDLPEG